MSITGQFGRGPVSELRGTGFGVDAAYSMPATLSLYPLADGSTRDGTRGLVELNCNEKVAWRNPDNRKADIINGDDINGDDPPERAGLAGEASLQRAPSDHSRRRRAAASSASASRRPRHARNPKP
jgi:hypothetical protein